MKAAVPSILTLIRYQQSLRTVVLEWIYILYISWHKNISYEELGEVLKPAVSNILTLRWFNTNLL